ncbi:MAG: hypothetical protein ACI4XA_00840 [Oscillospiraceae bacterium]
MTDKSYEKLLKAAGEKLGASPEQLRQTLEKGDVRALASGLSGSDREKLRAVLADKELMSRLKNAASPEEVIRLLSGKK